MTLPRRLSLNGVRVFVSVARHKSISLAARELHVTASAVSHQIKKLETDLGIGLFTRSNNAIDLTDAGGRFYNDALTGIGIIEKAAHALYRSENEITVRASSSLGVRWLIPALEEFRRKRPDVRICVETLGAHDVEIDHLADIAIAYRRAGEQRPGEETLLVDSARPMLSPHLLKQSKYRTLADIGRVPAIQSAADNWDWQCWMRHHRLDVTSLGMSHVFDTDDAALRAATAGLGMVLSSDVLAAFECDAGLLTDLPGTEAVELGRYTLATSPHQNATTRLFKDWLLAKARGSGSKAAHSASKKI